MVAGATARRSWGSGVWGSDAAGVGENGPGGAAGGHCRPYWGIVGDMGYMLKGHSRFVEGTVADTW